MFSVYKLPNQMPGEKVIKVIHRDFFILFKSVLLSILLMILPLLIVAALILGKAGIMDNEIFLPLATLGASAYYLFVWLFLFFNFVDYYLDLWIITTERIIDIEQRGFFSRTISEQKIANIQDITSEIKGVIPTLLKFGYLYIQTAAAKERFIFEDVPDPDGLRDIIIKLTENHKKE
ncbi:PH domain-containing protein, partial [Patescibacteria group bacterium]|nr:PH domain-containing protein [Patescibacteria group bacterium]